MLNIIFSGVTQKYEPLKPRTPLYNVTKMFYDSKLLHLTLNILSLN